MDGLVATVKLQKRNCISSQCEESKLNIIQHIDLQRIEPIQVELRLIIAFRDKIGEESRENS